MNLEYGNESGRVDTDQLFLIGNYDTFEYCLFFKLKGTSINGYGVQMFNQKCKWKMTGAKKFHDVEFEIRKVSKGN